MQYYFATLSEPRKAINQEHLLGDSVVTVVCAVIWERMAVAGFGKAKAKWFQRFPALPNAVLVHDTL